MTWTMKKCRTVSKQDSEVETLEVNSNIQIWWRLASLRKTFEQSWNEEEISQTDTWKQSFPGRGNRARSLRQENVGPFAEHQGSQGEWDRMSYEDHIREIRKVTELKAGGWRSCWAHGKYGRSARETWSGLYFGRITLTNKTKLGGQEQQQRHYLEAPVVI